MLTPDGHAAYKLEKVMLLSLWAKALRDENNTIKDSQTKEMIFAGLGKPTFPINAKTIASYLSYWHRLDDLSKKWQENPELESSAIDYGDPRGDIMPRTIMAKVMTRWYQSEIQSEDILFTIGGIGALRIIFETFNSHFEDIPGYRIITPFPYYSVYSNNPSHRLHPIHVMAEPGYKVTAKALEESIKEAYILAESDHGLPKALLLCNPSNPLGNIIDASEIKKIGDVLANYPDLYIIFDEAYAEMSFVEMPSFLKICPHLKERTIILRSATKALSAAGERMAIIIVFDRYLMSEMLNKNINYFIHAPRSAQMAYAETMEHFDEHDRQQLVTFYKYKVEYVVQRLLAMGASMPDTEYHVEATFYALGDFSELLGLQLPEKVEAILQKKGKVTTGEDLAYYLMINDHLMIAPLSYFGLSACCGFMRITCSGTHDELNELMNRLEFRLIQARKEKRTHLFHYLQEKIPLIKEKDPILYQEMISILDSLSQNEECLELKKQNNKLMKIKALIVSFLEYNQ
ncbi:MAG: pyridoxal phosphate-dependent aminotransferase [bacterium]|nr:pyridoxal phosphate-dependent aminotransferase [bacterium]